MRLIDGDAVEKVLRDYADDVGCNRGEYELANGILKAVSKLRDVPTAYDTEAVEKELENKFEQTVAEILDKTGSDFTIADFNVKRYSDRICEIVRKGGAT